MGTVRDLDVLAEAAASGAFKHWLLTKDAGAAPSFSKCLNEMYSLCMVLASVQLPASWDEVIRASCSAFQQRAALLYMRIYEMIN